MTNTDMKHTHTILPLGAALLTLAACQDGNDFAASYTPRLEAHYLNLPVTSVNLSASGQQKSLQVEAQNTAWQFTGMADWLTVSPDNGHTTTTTQVGATENTSAEQVRTSTVKFQSTDAAYPYQRDLTVTQGLATPYMTIRPGNTLSFGPAAASQQLTVEANIEWSVGQSSATWLTATRNGNTVGVAVSENQSLVERQATLRLTSDKLTRTVTVTQRAPGEPLVSDRSLEFQNTGGILHINLTTEVGWTADVSATAKAWLSVTPSEGQAGTNALTVEALPNGTSDERSGYLYIYLGQTQALSIPVKQKANYLRLNGQTQTFPANSASQQLQVESNTSWKVLTRPDWLTVSPDNGNGDATLTLTAADNWSLDSRSGILRIGREGTTLTAEATVTQAGRYFDDLVAQLQFSDKAASQSVTIKTDGRWTTVSSAPDWLSVSPAEGTGETTVQVSVGENTTDDKRSGHITVSVGGETQTIAVEQAGKYFTIDPTELAQLPSTGGQNRLHITTNEAWTAQSSSTWIQLSQKSGQGDIDVTLTAPDNPSIHARSDTTTFTPQHLQPIRVVTRQAARYLRVGADSLLFTAAASELPVSVSTDGTYTVSSSQPWLTVNRTEGGFTATVQENTGTDTRQAVITVSMTGLNQGETLTVDIPAAQRAKGTSVDLQPYGDEQQWDITVGSDFSVTVTTFGDEQSWD